MMLRIPLMTVAIGKVHRGERAISRKPLRRGGRLLPPVPVVFALFAQLFARGPRVHAATRPSLRPQLSKRATTMQSSGKTRRENAKLCLHILPVTARESGRSSTPRPIGSSTAVSGILDRPVKQDDDSVPWTTPPPTSFVRPC